MTRRRRLTLAILLLSLTGNLVLGVGILYWRVPMVRDTLLPIWRTLRGVHTPPISAVGSAQLTEGEVHLAISPEKATATVRLAAPPDGSAYAVELDTGEELVLGQTESTFKWSLHDGGSLGRPNVARIHSRTEGTEDRPVGEIELFRVSEQEGRENLDVDRSDGWVVVGRCTFDLVGALSTECLIREESVVLASLTQAEIDRIRGLFPALIRDNPDYASASELMAGMSNLLEWMCAHSLCHISAARNADLYECSPSDAISGVQRSEIGVLCQGFRSVFLWIALSTGWLRVEDVCEIDVFRYEPYRGIDVNSHALLELRAPEGAWIALDPYAQVAFTDQEGVYISTDAIRSALLEHRVDEINVIRLEEFRTSSTVSYYSEAGADWNRTDFDDRDPFNNNYWTNFGRIVYRTISLPAED